MAERTQEWVVQRRGRQLSMRRVAEEAASNATRADAGEPCTTTTTTITTSEGDVHVEHPLTWQVCLEATVATEQMLEESAAVADARAKAVGDRAGEASEGRVGSAEMSEGELGPGMVVYVPVGCRLQLRTRRDGDTLRPHWRGGAEQSPRRLVAVLRERRVPLHLRDTLPLLCLEGGVVVGVYPHVLGAEVHPAHARALSRGAQLIRVVLTIQLCAWFE